MRPRRLVLAGSVLVDLALRVEELPRRGDDVQAREAYASLGRGRPLLVTAVRYGLPAAFLGRTGDGPFGAQLRAGLAAAGVELLRPAPAAADSGFRVVLLEPGGARTVVTSPGAGSGLTADDLDGVALRAGDAVHVGGHDLAAGGSGPALTAWAARLPRPVALVVDPGRDAGAVPWSRLERVLQRADVVALGRGAARALLGTTRPRAAAEALTAYAPRLRVALLRAGADGCHVYEPDTGGRPVEVPAPPVEPVDTAGAGEVHTAVFLAGLAAGVGVVAAAGRATAAASLATVRPGTVAPDPDRLDDLLRRRRNGA